MRVGKGRFGFLREQRGIGLIETVVAVAILGFIGVTVVASLDTNYRAVRTLDERVVATNLATAYIEAIKAMDYAPSYDDPETIITVPPQYSVNVDITFTDDGDTTDGIEWGYISEGKTIQKLTVTVSREGGKPILTICAFKTKRQQG